MMSRHGNWLHRYKVTGIMAGVFITIGTEFKAKTNDVPQLVTVEGGDLRHLTVKAEDLQYLTVRSAAGTLWGIPLEVVHEKYTPVSPYDYAIFNRTCPICGVLVNHSNVAYEDEHDKYPRIVRKDCRGRVWCKACTDEHDSKDWDKVYHGE